MKTLNDVMTEWSKDAKIDETEIGSTASNLAVIHNKYYLVLMRFRHKFKKTEAAYDSLKKIKYEYYTGILPEETLKEKGWKPFSLRVLKSDLDIYMAADNDLQALKSQMTELKEAVEYITSIIQTINNRGYLLKTMVDWLKFTNGIS